MLLMAIFILRFPLKLCFLYIRVCLGGFVYFGGQQIGLGDVSLDQIVV